MALMFIEKNHDCKPILIGISGKKQSGKSSLAEFIKAWHWCNVQSIDKGFLQGDLGNIVWSAAAEAILKSENDFDDAAMPHGLTHIGSFADALKQSVCMDVLGLSEEQCYGTDEQKNSLTNYRWENLPNFIRQDYSTNTEETIRETGQREFGGAGEREVTNHIVPRTGHMTAREVMQVVGTDIFRKMFSDQVWVNATLKIIQQSDADIFIVPDVRFESEVVAIVDNGGYIIRLGRQVANDIHESENALDDYPFDTLGDRCLIIDNDSLKMNEKNHMAAGFIKVILDKQGATCDG